MSSVSLINSATDIPGEISLEAEGIDPGETGAANSAAINRALSKASGSGGFVSLMKPGSYAITADNFTPVANTSLFLGAGVTFTVSSVAVPLASLSSMTWGPGSTSGTFRTSSAQIVAPYRMITFGDSRARASNSTQIGVTGSATYYNTAREAPWITALLGDTEIVGDFGISGDPIITSVTTNGWNGTARSNSKTIANALQLRPDVCWIQYGINDIAAGATSAAIIVEFKKLVSELMAGGVKVVVESIMLFDPTAGSATIGPGAAVAAQVKLMAVNAALKTWCAGFAGRVVFVDNTATIQLASTGYGDPQYFDSDAVGVHPNKKGAQLLATKVAAAARTLLPLRIAGAYFIGPSENPNLVDWNSPTMLTGTETGTVTISTPTWNLDTSTGNPYSGLPYAECSFTCTALASGTSKALLEIHATGISGATPTWPIFAGDVIQSSAYLVIDDGAGGTPSTQTAFARQRLYANAKFSDFGVLGGTSDLTTLASRFAGRVVTSTITTSIASASITAATFNSGLPLQIYVEIPTVGATVRVRVYAPQIRVVSRAQPVSLTAGASPYTYINGPSPFVAADYVNQGYFGRDLQVAVAPGSGGTISQIAIARGPQVGGVFLNPVNTNLTNGVFTLKPGDGLTVTWAAVAPTLAVMQVS